MGDPGEHSLIQHLQIMWPKIWDGFEQAQHPWVVTNVDRIAPRRLHQHVKRAQLHIEGYSIPLSSMPNLHCKPVGAQLQLRTLYWCYERKENQFAFL